jgi:putative addiction module component (TIGR02574 family)
MARSAKEILEEARQLPPDQIDWLVESLLIKDADEPQTDLGASWESEVKRRIDEIDSGAVKLVPLEDVFSRMDLRAARRKT